MPGWEAWRARSGVAPFRQVREGAVQARRAAALRRGCSWQGPSSVRRAPPQCRFKNSRCAAARSPFSVLGRRHSFVIFDVSSMCQKYGPALGPLLVQIRFVLPMMSGAANFGRISGQGSVSLRRYTDLCTTSSGSAHDHSSGKTQFTKDRTGARSLGHVSSCTLLNKIISAT